MGKVISGQERIDTSAGQHLEEPSPAVVSQKGFIVDPVRPVGLPLAGVSTLRHRILPQLWAEQVWEQWMPTWLSFQKPWADLTACLWQSLWSKGMCLWGCGNDMAFPWLFDPRIVEANPRKFNLDATELSIRKSFITSTRQVVRVRKMILSFICVRNRQTSQNSFP